MSGFGLGGVYPVVELLGHVVFLFIWGGSIHTVLHSGCTNLHSHPQRAFPPDPCMASSSFLGFFSFLLLLLFFFFFFFLHLLLQLMEVPRIGVKSELVESEAYAKVTATPAAVMLDP